MSVEAIHRLELYLCKYLGLVCALQEEKNQGKILGMLFCYYGCTSQ